MKNSLPWKWLLLCGLWAVFVIWMIWGTCASLWSTLFPNRNAYAIFSTAGTDFALNFWGLAAALTLASAVLNLGHWYNRRRLLFACFAAVIVLARLEGGGVGGLTAALQLNPVLLFVIAPFAMIFSGALTALALFLIASAIWGLVVAVPVMFFSQLLSFDNAITRYRYQSRGLAYYIVRGVYWLRNEEMPKSAPDESKGARFAADEEVAAAVTSPSNPKAMAFGHRPNDVGTVFLETTKHVLIMASTRSGKGVSLIIPHLLRYQGSAFVLDPKGENAVATGRRRAQLNQEVHYLDPFGISGKPQSRFNPLSRFTRENMEAESKALAAALFIGERDHDHWQAAGQQLLAALILYVFVSPDVMPEDKDLAKVRSILLSLVVPTLNAMVKMSGENQLLADLAASFLATPEKEFGSVVSTAQRQTEILDNPFIIACLKASRPRVETPEGEAPTVEAPEVDFSKWHTGTMTVYLCLSAPKFPTFNRWLRLVLTAGLDEMTDRLKPPALPVCFMLDELATLGHLEPVENAVGLAAGYGVQLISVFQDVAQMRDLYKGRWASFIGNAGVRALFSLEDYDTAEYWSKFLGTRVKETYSRKRDEYGMSSGDTVSESLNPLVAPYELMMHLSEGNMLVLKQGTRPFFSGRLAYTNDPTLAGLWDDPRFRAAAPADKPQPPPPSPWPQSPVSKPVTVSGPADNPRLKAAAPADEPEPRPSARPQYPAADGAPPASVSDPALAEIMEELRQTLEEAKPPESAGGPVRATAAPLRRDEAADVKPSPSTPAVIAAQPASQPQSIFDIMREREDSQGAAGTERSPVQELADLMREAASVPQAPPMRSAGPRPGPPTFPLWMKLLRPQVVRDRLHRHEVAEKALRKRDLSDPATLAFSAVDDALKDSVFDLDEPPSRPRDRGRE